MSLIEQIKVIAFTFIFGIIGAFFFNIFYKILFNKRVVIKIFSNFMVLLLFSTIYFYFIYQINGGILHIYLLLVFFISFYLYNKLFKKIRWNG